MWVDFEADIFFNPFWKENVKKSASTLVSMMAYSKRDTFFMYGVKRERDIVK